MEYPLTKFNQFSKYGIREIFSQRSTTSPYMWN